MTITVTWQTVVTAGAVLAAVLAIVAYFAKAVRWVDKQRKQDKEISATKYLHDSNIGDQTTGLLSEEAAV